MVGELALVLYAWADAPDSDLCAKLLDLYPDGRAIYLNKLCEMFIYRLYEM